MRKKPLYNFAQLIIVGGMCSASICSVSFAGSFIDCLASAPLGALLVAIQLLSVRNELYGNVFEITIATLLSFASAALASTKHFCYSAVASSSVVLILPVSARIKSSNLRRSQWMRIYRASLFSAALWNSRRVPWWRVRSDYALRSCIRSSWALVSPLEPSYTRNWSDRVSSALPTTRAWSPMILRDRGGSRHQACGGHS
jgi:hypothetical protein